MQTLCNTAEFSKLNGIKPASVRSRLWQSGSYYGIKPVKHANRRLLWPRVMVTPDKVFSPGTPGQSTGDALVETADTKPGQQAE